MKANLLVRTFIVFLSMIGINQATYANTLTENEACNEEINLYSTDTFITKWTTTAANTQITFPLYFNSGTLTIDWGDGTVEANLGESPTHTYATAGTYIVTVLSGQIDRIRFSEAASSTQYIVDVMQWGTNTWTSTQFAFQDCRNLDVTATDAPDLSNVMVTSNMFDGCRSLVGTAAFNTWDTSNVGHMFAMFDGCLLFNQDLDTWDVSRVKEMRNMFRNARAFNGNISTWNVGNVERCSSMFLNAKDFNQPLNNWDTSSVHKMIAMFQGATSFNQPLNNWNVSNVTEMGFMFQEATAFNQPLNNWNTSSVEDMTVMFRDATNFNQPLDNWDVSNVTSMPGIFEGCIAFDKNLGNWDISNIVSVSSFDGLNNMFKDAGLSTLNYDNTLVGWHTLDSGETQIPTGIRLNGGNSNYCVSATQRQDLINTYGWTFTDAGLSCPNVNVNVPNVVNQLQTVAQTTLMNEGLQIGTITEVYNPNIPAGTVISQDPISGTSVAYGSNVNLEVSLGNYPLLITGIISKNNESLGAIELYVTNDIPDLSIYAVGVENGFDGSEGAEYYLSGSASAGDFLYLAEYPTVFQTFFGFAPDFDMGGTNALLPSGNDAVELFVDVNGTPTRIDVYGDPNANGFGTPWAYKNSWVYRKTGTVASGSFVINDWRIPGPEIISNVSITNTNAPVPFPTGTYGQSYDEVPPVAICQDITFEVNQGNFTVAANLIDNSSTDDVGVTFMKLDDSSYFCSDAGDNLVTLTVYDAAGNKDTCTATINIIPAAPQIICQDITVDLGFNGQAVVTFSDISNGISGACLSEGTQLYISTTNPNSSGASNLFDGATTTSSPTDDILGFGVGQYYQDFTFTVPTDGNYLPSFSFTSSTTDDILVAVISDQPVAPNTGDVPARPGFLDAFIYEAPSTYQGSFSGNDEVALTAGVTYYMQVIIFNGDNPSMLSTGTFSGDFGGVSQNLDEVTYTTADLGDNTLYAYFTDTLGRMTSCAATVTVVNADPFITTWKTDNLGDSNDNQITIPTTGSGYRFDVDWGDGLIDNGVGGSFITHTYATPGTYTVKITGDFPRMSFAGGGDAAKLLTIEQWGDIKWDSMLSAFYGCTNLDITATDTPDLSNVTNMQNMFRDAVAFDQDLSAWDITNVTSMNDMFLDAGLSKDNYDNTLIGWHTDSSGMAGDGIDDVPSGITFNGGNSKYCVAETEREDLITAYNWTITDSGIACPRFQAKVFLQGASLDVTVNSFLMMRDALRENNLIPTTSPYDGITSFDPGILSNNDEEAIVDWILVELRDATDNTNVVFSGSYLLRRDGFITTTTEGVPRAKVPDGDYYIVIKHRNHLGIMSATPINIFPDNFTALNFADGTTATYGTDAQTTFGMPAGYYGMWAGNTNNDNFIQYTGTSSDTPSILSEVLNDDGNSLNLPTFTVTGYTNQDINMDGNAQYSGTSPDTPIILQNVLAHPGNFLNFSTYQIMEQLPEND